MDNSVQRARGFRAGDFLRLALPMIVSRAGLAVMSIADGVMVSRYRPVEFAWLSLAEGTLGRLLDIFIAFVVGGLLLASRHFASGDREGAQQVWLRTVPVSVGLGVAGALAGLCGRPLLSLLDQRPELAQGTAPVMAILGAGYPAALLAIAAAVYLEAVQRPQVVAACVVFANLLNIGLNWLLIGGHTWGSVGIAAMGARGSALSTTLMRCLLACLLVAFAWERRQKTIVNPALAAERTNSRRSQWRLSAGAAASVAAMIALGSSLVLFAGRLGVLPLAIFSAAWGLGAPVALVTMGMADATGVSVAAEDGRAGLSAARDTAWAALRLTFAVVGMLTLILALLSTFFAGLYAKDPSLRATIASMLPVVALILIADAMGFIASSSLRAVRQAAWPAGVEIGAMLLMVPLAGFLAFRRGLGVRGLFFAMLAAGILRAALLAVLFISRTRKGYAPRVPEPDPAAQTPSESLCRTI